MDGGGGRTAASKEPIHVANRPSRWAADGFALIRPTVERREVLIDRKRSFIAEFILVDRGGVAAAARPFCDFARPCIDRGAGLTLPRRRTTSTDDRGWIIGT